MSTVRAADAYDTIRRDVVAGIERRRLRTARRRRLPAPGAAR
jgi:hypothetical protein